MKNETCERYFEDPEANSAHLEECADCRAFFGELETPVEHRPMAVQSQALPLAPWEGAAHRPWPLIVGGALTVFAIAVALFVVAGVSPVAGLAKAFTSGLPPYDLVMSGFRLAGGFVQNAPIQWQIAIGISFVVINSVLYLLLRRAPKGIDA